MSNDTSLLSFILCLFVCLIEFVRRAFKKFKYAHDLTDTTKAVSLATKCVIEDFAADNVVYLEMRSTPRRTPTMTKDEYITAVINAIKYFPVNIRYLVHMPLYLFHFAENQNHCNRRYQSN